MSQENVDTLRRAIEAFNSTNQMDAIEAILDPGVELHGAIGGFEEGSVVRGRERVVEGLRMDPDVWAERRLEVQRFVDANDRVVVLVTEHRRGLGSEVPVSADTAAIYSFEGGRVVRIEPYMNPAEALEAVGLSE